MVGGPGGSPDGLRPMRNTRNTSTARLAAMRMGIEGCILEDTSWFERV